MQPFQCSCLINICKLYSLLRVIHWLYAHTHTCITHNTIYFFHFHLYLGFISHSLIITPRLSRMVFFPFHFLLSQLLCGNRIRDHCHSGLLYFAKYFIFLHMTFLFLFLLVHCFCHRFWVMCMCRRMCHSDVHRLEADFEMQFSVSSLSAFQGLNSGQHAELCLWPWHLYSDFRDGVTVL